MGFKPADCTVCSIIAITTPRYYTYSTMVFWERVLSNMTGRFLRTVLYLQNTEWPHAGKRTVEWLQPYKNDISHNATVNSTNRTRSEKFATYYFLIITRKIFLTGKNLYMRQNAKVKFYPHQWMTSVCQWPWSNHMVTCKRGFPPPNNKAIYWEVWTRITDPKWLQRWTQSNANEVSGKQNVKVRAKLSSWLITYHTVQS
jgi:hypothetical protein